MVNISFCERFQLDKNRYYGSLWVVNRIQH